MKLLHRTALIVAVAAMALDASAATLTHRYSFNDGTADDSVGSANGTLMFDANVSGGQVNFDGTDDFLDLPGGTIAINTYPSVTLELWSTQGTTDQGFSMTASFGDTFGNGFGQNYLMISTTRGDSTTRGAIAVTPDDTNPWEDEVGVNHSGEFNDAAEHYYALTVNGTDLSFYIDGALEGTASLAGPTTSGEVNLSLSGLSNTYAYLGKGTYSVDGQFAGSINEYRIWNGALDASQISAAFAAGPNAVVPEPSTYALIGLGLVSLAFLRRRS